jgi:hypothetical protein
MIHTQEHGIDALDKARERVSTIQVPGFAQEMIESDINKDMRIPPVSGFKHRLTCLELITVIGEAINLTMQVYATDDSRKEIGGQPAFETVSGHVSDEYPGVVSRK